MIWIILSVVLLILMVLFALRPKKVPREPGREGLQEGDAVTAYDRTSHWLIFAIERRIILHEINRDKPQGLLLDIGCGSGFLAAAISRRLKSSTVIGLDVNKQMIDIAERRWPTSSYSNLTFLSGDVQQLPFADNTINYIVSSLSLHHWKDPESAFREMYRVLKPGGRFLVYDLRRDGPIAFYYALKIGQILIAPRAIKETNGAVGSFWASYTSSEIENILSKTPLRLWEIKNRFGWLLIRGNVEDK